MIIQEKVPGLPLSVIIPALNEQDALPGTLAGLERQPESPPFEVILADGGSQDGTADRFAEITRSWSARERPARLLACPRSGRAAQMNMGAAAATGKTLLFLHADTLLPRGATPEVAGAFDDPRVVAGAFGHSFIEPGAILRLISLWASARSRLLGIHLGDQAMFVRRSTFEELGGFPDVPLFEDLRLSRALRARGRVVTLDLTVATSSRRLSRRRVLASALHLAWLELRHFFGADPRSLKKEYPDIR